jgi:hypothetical protein
MTFFNAGFKPYFYLAVNTVLLLIFFCEEVLIRLLDKLKQCK